MSGKAHVAQRKQFGLLLGKLQARDTVVVSKRNLLGRVEPQRPGTTVQNLFSDYGRSCKIITRVGVQ